MVARKKKEENVIPVIGKKKYSKYASKDSKKKEVYPFKPNDVKKMIEYFENNEKWIHYLLFIISCNMARRIGDTLSLRWYHFFDENGKFRENLLEIEEDKTDKLANPRINLAVQNAIKRYIKETHVDVSKNNYGEYVFLQLSGTHKGDALSRDGSLKAIKDAAKKCGITYNVGNHSTRKTFGMINRMLHPNDYDSMQILQSIYNHSSERATMHYIGLTKEKTDKYYDDMGDFFEGCVSGDKEITIDDSPVVTLNSSDLRDIIKAAYDAGIENSGHVDYNVHIKALNSIMNIVDRLKK